MWSSIIEAILNSACITFLLILSPASSFYVKIFLMLLPCSLLITTKSLYIFNIFNCTLISSHPKQCWNCLFETNMLAYCGSLLCRLTYYPIKSWKDSSPSPRASKNPYQVYKILGTWSVTIEAILTSACIMFLCTLSPSFSF